MTLVTCVPLTSSGWSRVVIEIIRLRKRCPERTPVFESRVLVSEGVGEPLSSFLSKTATEFSLNLRRNSTKSMPILFTMKTTISLFPWVVELKFTRGLLFLFLNRWAFWCGALLTLNIALLMVIGFALMMVVDSAITCERSGGEKKSLQSEKGDKMGS